MNAEAAPNTVSLESTPTQSPRVVSRLVSGEHILVPLASRGADIDSIFNLNTTGSFIWERIDGARTGADLAALVSQRFGIEPERAASDCREFLSQLLEVRAIEVKAARS